MRNAGAWRKRARRTYLLIRMYGNVSSEHAHLLEVERLVLSHPLHQPFVASVAVGTLQTDDEGALERCGDHTKPHPSYNCGHGQAIETSAGRKVRVGRYSVEHTSKPVAPRRRGRRNSRFGDD